MNKICQCNSDAYHSFYAKKQKTYCFRCSCYVDSQSIGEPVEQEYRPLVMPTEIMYSIKADPWPNLSIELMNRYHFYPCPAGELGEKRFLVLPVYRDGSPVFWTARNLAKDTEPKYISAKGVKKQYWLSDEQYPTGDLFIAESIADACYMSQLGQSIGLLGTSYNGSLDNWMKSANRIIIAFDGDAVGRVQSLILARYLRDNLINKNIYILPIPMGSDPVDMKLDELKLLVEESI